MLFLVFRSLFRVIQWRSAYLAEFEKNKVIILKLLLRQSGVSRCLRAFPLCSLRSKWIKAEDLPINLVFENLGDGGREII